MSGLGPLLAYIGPETIVPATSVLAAVGGLVLTFGSRLTRPLVSCARALIVKRDRPNPAQACSEEIPATDKDVR
jgi:hypothetical protein